MLYQGKARLNRKTKDLVKIIKPREIAVIDHEDLDAMGALGLAEAGVTVVLNAADSITGRYPNLGPQMLLERKITLIDKFGADIFTKIEDGDLLKVENGCVYANEEFIAEGRILSSELVLAAMEDASTNLTTELGKFVDNTMEYMDKEKDLIITGITIPKTKTPIMDKHVVVVVRGMGYREDLRAIRPYIEEMNPVLIGVDGGADALLECGLKPDMIIGDMDSVTEEALKSNAEIFVHAYHDGKAPGTKNLNKLGIPYKIFPAPGTSEDIALLLAYELGAKLIVAVGLHSHIIDFLEKGRPGMASTFLTRMKIGSILVDAKGVSQLYSGKSGYLPISVVIAALVPITLFVMLATPWRQLLRLLWLQIRLALGGLF